jgi:hypothetical protein
MKKSRHFGTTLFDPKSETFERLRTGREGSAMTSLGSFYGVVAAQ